MTEEVTTSTKRQRRKDRNKANTKAKSSSVRKDRIKRYGAFLIVTAIVIALIVLVATVMPNLDPNTPTSIHNR